jgi:hypothetical protein
MLAGWASQRLDAWRLDGLVDPAQRLGGRDPKHLEALTWLRPADSPNLAIDSPTRLV